jgi:hypothetical protein
LDSIGNNTSVPCRVLFLVSPSDAIEVQAIQQENAELWAAKGGYAAKIREGVAVTDEPFLFFAADDLEFRPQWYERAKALIDRGAEVVGVNDLIRRKRRHATHFLVTREYAERTTIDGEPGPMSDAYFHWFVDDEFIATAEHRRVTSRQCPTARLTCGALWCASSVRAGKGCGSHVSQDTLTTAQLIVYPTETGWWSVVLLGPIWFAQWVAGTISPGQKTGTSGSAAGKPEPRSSS